MSNTNDFEIQNGVLKNYRGEGGEVVIPDGVTGIGQGAFSRNRELTSVTLPEGVMMIGEGAFYCCGNLTGVVIPETVTSIEKKAFLECRNLTSVVIPEGVMEICESAFSCCFSLADVAISNGVTTIGGHAFSGCKLSSIVIPRSVTNIGISAFSGCKSLTSVVMGNGMKAIGTGAFRSCENLTDIVIPDGVTEIGSQAFMDCNRLASIALPNSVVSIGDGAFDGCKNLTRIVIPDSARKVGENAFRGCERLMEVVVSNPEFRFGGKVFGAHLPLTLMGQAGELFHHLSDAGVRTYFANEKDWGKLTAEIQAEIFLERQDARMIAAYEKCVKYPDRLGETLLARISESPSEAQCKALANFMVSFGSKLSAAMHKHMTEALALFDEVEEAVETVLNNRSQEEKATAEKKAEAERKRKESLSPIEQKLFAIMESRKESEAELKSRLKACYGLSPSDIPDVKCRDGNVAPPMVMMWLLTVHEKSDGSKCEIAYEQAGLCAEAAEIAAELDEASLQAFLRKLSRDNLGIKGHSKKMYLAYPICRYADETLMEELTKLAPSWRSSVSGNNAPPLQSFRKASRYSNTRAAMLFADRYGELDQYAELRGSTPDDIRDQLLSDVGLDDNGCKRYDLGNQIVTVRLQTDLSFLVEMPNGKTAKSLPMKGADEAKYTAANADFSRMKKDAKRIMKNRRQVLFEDFLSGRYREAKNWCEAYLHNPLLRSVASLLVWEQDGKTFTLKDGSPIDISGQPYTIGKTEICVAHPMEMKAEDITAWQKYLTAHALKQPFEQMWEPVHRGPDIRSDRYKGCEIPYYRFTNMEKHGITVEDRDFHNSIDITFVDCYAEVKRLLWSRHEIGPNHPFEVESIWFHAYTRRVNHIVGLLDKWTITGRLMKDDVSVAPMFEGLTLAQITEFIRLADENRCTNVMALLLDYKNRTFADFDPMDEFTLDALN